MQSSSKDQSVDSPKAYFDEANRKVMIVSIDPNEGNEVQHCITWRNEAEAGEIEKAIEGVLFRVKRENESKRGIAK